MTNPFTSNLASIEHRLGRLNTKLICGKVVQSLGAVVKASVSSVAVGDLCEFKSENEETLCHGEVIGFDQDLAIIALLGDAQGLSTRVKVIPLGNTQTVQVSDELIGRVLDGMGNLIDGGAPLKEEGVPRKIYSEPPPPLQRKLIHQPLPMRVRALDSLLTIGEGQRVGIFAAAGVGKSTLLGQLINGAECDVRVIALIGERGREVREFIEHSIGVEGMKKTIIVCATSDKGALERARAAYLATAIAEHFRDKGKKVLLMMDSITRFARALREIGLSAGEPPTRQGFPPSVFATLPRLLERSGMGATGSITAIYTVLVEGDDMTEPVADETRSILDGHIILSRDLASTNHFPAIDVLASVSRVMGNISTPEHIQLAGKLRELIASYKKAEILIKVGEYQKGSDPKVDEAIVKWDKINHFLQQGVTEFSEFNDTQSQLQALLT